MLDIIIPCGVLILIFSAIAYLAWEYRLIDGVTDVMMIGSDPNHASMMGSISFCFVLCGIVWG